MRSLFAVLLLAISTISFAEQQQLTRISVVARDGSPVRDTVVSSGGPISAAPGVAVMDQVDKTFKPYVLAVGKGTSVLFPNSDQIRHHVYSFSDAKPFELRLYSGNPESPIEFDVPGIIVVGCNIHDNMVGYIYVSPRAHWAVTNDKGMADLEIENGKLHIWFPTLSLGAERELALKLSELEKTADGYQVTLDIDPPPSFPQAVRTTDRDRFKRYLD